MDRRHVLSGTALAALAGCASTGGEAHAKPVFSVAQPTLRIDRLTVGGTA